MFGSSSTTRICLVIVESVILPVDEFAYVCGGDPDLGGASRQGRTGGTIGYRLLVLQIEPSLKYLCVFGR